MAALVVDRVEALPEGFRVASLPKEPLPRSVLMVSPGQFRVDYAINPHMVDAAGRLNVVDPALATAQWHALRRSYEAIGYPVHVIEGQPGLPDMVFAANQSLPFLDLAGRPAVALSRMRHAERAPEVAHFERFYRERGYRVVAAPTEDASSLEGEGDVLFVPGRRLAVAGHGFRSARSALDAVAAVLERPVIALRLLQEGFYHLDTCLVPIDDRRALFVPGAFEPEGRALLGRCFERLIEVPEDEARGAFAANAHVPDGRNALIDQRAEQTIALLEAEGLRVHALDTSEFRKSGGSVFCLKMMLPTA